MNTINTYLKPLDFSKYFKRVVEWNATARGGKHDFSDKTLNKQKELVAEEIKELKEAIDISDTVEVLDALCDIFVVASYYHFLQMNGELKDLSLKILTPLSGIDYYTSMIYDFETLDNGLMVTSDVCALLYQFNGFATAALEEVLSSNDSKFPKVEKFGKQKVKRELALNNECAMIETRSEGRYSGVKWEIRGDRVVFLDDTGKIMKPFTFKSPNLKPFC